MNNDPIRVEFRLGHDPRLIAAVWAAVQFQAAQVGLDATSCEQFAQASRELCHEAIQKLTDGDGALEITLHTFPDRMELSVQHRGQLIPALGLETFAVPDGHKRGSDTLNGADLLACVDRVLFDTQDGMARTTLVKMIAPKP